MTDVLELPNLATLNKEQLRQIVNDGLDAVVVMDDKGLLVDWNSQAEAIFGWSRKEALGQRLVDLIIPPEHRAAHQQGLEHYLATSEGPVLRKRIEITALRKNGAEFSVELTVLPVHLEDGVIFSAFVRDITEFKQLKDRKELEDRFRQLSQAVEQSASIIVITNTRGVIEYVNAAFVKTTGYSEAEAIGAHTRILKSGDTPAEEYKKMWKTISAGREWRGEFHNKRKDGSLYWELTTISPIKDETGKITHYLAVKEDITEQKKVTAALTKRSREMEIVARVAIAISLSRSPEELLQQVVDLTKEHFNLYHAHVYLLDSAGENLNLAAGAGEPGAKMVTQGWRIPFNTEQSLVAQAARTRQTVIINDVRAAPHFLPNPLLPATRAELAAPLVVEDRVLGVLDVQSDTVNYFSDDDTIVYTTLAVQSATVLRSARLLEQTEFALEEAKMLRRLADQSYQASADMNTAQSYDDILTVLRRHTILGQGAQNISLNYFDVPWQEDRTPTWILVLSRWSELPAEALSSRYPVSAFPSVNTLLKFDAPTIIENVSTDPRMDENARALYTQRFGAKSTVFAPMVVGGQWIGYVNGIYQQHTEFQGADVRRLTSLVGQAAALVQSFQRLQETERRIRREQTLHKMGAAMRKSLDTETILKTGLQAIGQELGLAGAAIRLASGEED